MSTIRKLLIITTKHATMGYQKPIVISEICINKDDT